MTRADSDPRRLSDGATLVEYCLANVSPAERQRLESTDVQCRGVRCLDRCGTCYRESFVVVDGEPVTGAPRSRLLDSRDGSETP